MIDAEKYEMNKRIEDLPVKTLMMKPDKNVPVKGVIQMLHGMCEYKERYLDIMGFFVKNGYICVINDMVGHGENVSFFKELGYFGNDGAKKVIESSHAVTAFIKNNFPDLPVILFGHSLGSFIARALIRRYDDDYDKVILTGSPSNRFGKQFGMFMAEVLSLIGDEKKTSIIMDAIVMGKYYMSYREEKLKNSWICTDVEVVKAFNENMYSNFTFTINGYNTLLNLMSDAYSFTKWQLKNKRMPVIFMAGEDDPCILSEKAFESAANALRKRGYRNVETKLYKNMRHEIFNEKQKQMVYKDMLSWIEG